ncbi:hypothetical protein ACH5RR_009498 [Cinchona calisaya]|uniref:Uncharacterized protein n=1 Tax=Cinchona calisaya TaxID=153742 RepID=A0ABD3AED0_9GENT
MVTVPEGSLISTATLPVQNSVSVLGETGRKDGASKAVKIGRGARKKTGTKTLPLDATVNPSSKRWLLHITKFVLPICKTLRLRKPPSFVTRSSPWSALSFNLAGVNEKNSLGGKEGNRALMFKKKYRFRALSNKPTDKPKGFTGLCDHSDGIEVMSSKDGGAEVLMNGDIGGGVVDSVDDMRQLDLHAGDSRAGRSAHLEEDDERQQALEAIKSSRNAEKKFVTSRMGNGNSPLEGKQLLQLRCYSRQHLYLLSHVKARMTDIVDGKGSGEVHLPICKTLRLRKPPSSVTRSSPWSALSFNLAGVNEKNSLGGKEGNRALMFKKKYRFRALSSKPTDKPKGFTGLYDRSDGIEVMSSKDGGAEVLMNGDIGGGVVDSVDDMWQLDLHAGDSRAGRSAHLEEDDERQQALEAIKSSRNAEKKFVTSRFSSFPKVDIFLQSSEVFSKVSLVSLQ